MQKRKQDYQAAFDTFMENEAKEAIIKSTIGGFKGEEDIYWLELFADGTYRVLWNGRIGNQYVSKGILLAIPELDSEEVNREDLEESYFEDAIEAMIEKFNLYFEMQKD